jgi:hypothetical protein
MQITVQLPDDLTQHPDPARETLEAFAIESYRSGALTPYQTRLLLGFGTRDQFNGFLKKNEVWDHAYGIEDFESDRSDFDTSK